MHDTQRSNVEGLNYKGFILAIVYSSHVFYSLFLVKKEENLNKTDSFNKNGYAIDSYS